MEYQHQQCQFLMYFRYRGATKGAEPFFENNVNIDVIQSYASFDEYQVLLLPVMIVYKKEVQEKIKYFVMNHTDKTQELKNTIVKPYEVLIV
ncbi:MAG: beta-galactosidase trimerization domain-containing protein [Terrisporobacter othiniensis]|uniref:beta-galactosidase trimerization domain-containing protein n=1 Tax=Terrisporobacter othiniensis TaxID=1577792 RepID=UPI00291585B3|nr:beta-galactosidase trimerization domain-containing protein [Terrisporobacter othiniensis]MDU6983981.1 beta-galactosidase trimerization domain-containing protein [Terrisporobacter othiniensis]